MQKSIAWLLLLCMLLCTLPAMAEESFTMAGYDDSTVGHIWEDNLFFQRMEERTGVHFTFDQSTEYDAWQQKKEAMFASGDLPDVLFKACLLYTSIPDPGKQKPLALRQRLAQRRDHVRLVGQGHIGRHARRPLKACRCV